MVKTEPLFIFLNADSQPTWGTASEWHHGETDRLKQASLDREVIVIVPGVDVFLATVTLPVMSKGRLLQALPYALEEQLVADVDQLHFAASEQEPNGRLTVAVVAKTKMQQWRNLLREWHVLADKMLPDYLLLPASHDEWHVWVHTLSAVRFNVSQGMGVDHGNLSTILALELQNAVDLPKKIHFYNLTSHAYAPTFTSTCEVQEHFIPAERFFSEFVSIMDARSTVNLLQGEFSEHKPHPWQVKWRVTAYLAAICLGLFVLYPTISYIILKYEELRLEHQAAAIYQKHFPAVNSSMIAKARMQDKLESLMAQIGQSRLLLLLGYVGEGLAEHPDIKLKRFDFHANHLTLEVSAASTDEISLFADFLTQQGLHVAERGADMKGSRPQVTMVIE